MKAFFSALAAVLLFAGCGGQSVSPLTSNATTATSGASHRSAGHLILLSGARPDGNCPSKYVYCVTVSKGQSVQLYFCFSTVSYCGPSQPQYSWLGTFHAIKGKQIDSFSGTFDPNPGDPTYDTISEAHRVRSSHGKIKYYQLVCVYLSGGSCLSEPRVGIRTQ